MKQQNKEALESIGVDIQQTLARFVGNEGLLFKFLGKFPSDTSYAQMKAAIEAGNMQEAFHHAHTLKGVAGNLGLDNLYTATSPLVEALRGEDTAQTEVLFPPVQAAYAQAMQTLEGIDEIPR